MKWECVFLWIYVEGRPSLTQNLVTFDIRKKWIENVSKRTNWRGSTSDLHIDGGNQHQRNGTSKATTNRSKASSSWILRTAEDDWQRQLCCCEAGQEYGHQLQGNPFRNQFPNIFFKWFSLYASRSVVRTNSINAYLINHTWEQRAINYFTYLYCYLYSALASIYIRICIPLDDPRI